ncbi:WD-repeat protein [Calothrix sp. NIES-4101]|nr:WD-repeat protein [Calothrix sp. NIES-4101]
MKKLVILQFDGDFSTGYQVTLEVGDEGKRPHVRIRGALPTGSSIISAFRDWRSCYRSIYSSDRSIYEQSRIKTSGGRNINLASFTQQCNESAERLLFEFNSWLESPSFEEIRNCLLALHPNQELINQELINQKQIKPKQEIRIILSSDCPELRKLPWHLWNLWLGNEVALSATNAVKRERPYREKIRILIVLGDSTGINIKRDRAFLEQYCRDAEIVTLVQPERDELNRYLQDEIGWDILSFSGHSHTQDSQGRIFINQHDSLTMGELRDSLQVAIQQRLQLAIFNSCDGLGIAYELESLHIPQVIVMREPVPDLVAQEFLKYFLEAFTGGSYLGVSVGYARKKLALLEDDFPCASWLPVIIQNQLEIPPTWQSLGITTSPYRGLMAFREEDAENFFGRETFIEQLVIDVNRKPLVTVIGASGSGKSSVVFAGLIPQLRRDENSQWRIICFRPGKNPFESLAVALMGDGEIGENSRYQELELEVELKQDMSALGNIIAEMSGDVCRVLLVVDQFEEIYTLCSNLKERQILIDGLLNVCRDERFSATVVMTLRADFLGKAMSYQTLGKALQDFPPSLLVPMSRAELERAIIQPAARYSVELEEGLVNKLIDDVGSGEGSLPLQQFALTQLWGKQRPGLLTHQAYIEIGGVTQAVANHAKAVYAGLSEEQQKRAQRLFIQLVQPGEGTEDTRRLATRDEVGDYWDLVTLLANERLLVTNRNELVEDTVEVVHEALIRNWGRLRGWMDDNREFRVWQERLKVALQQWVDSNKDDGGLLRGATLAVAEDWLQKRGEEVSKAQRWFIEKGVELREREKKQKERLRRRVIGGLATGLVLALSLAGFAGWQWREVQVRETNAQLIAGSLSAQKLLESKSNDLEALVEAVKTGKSLRHSLGVQPEIKMQTLATLNQVVYGVKEHNRLPSGAISVCFSPDGNIIASSGLDGIIKLWSKNGKLLQSFKGHEGIVYSIRFSPNGNTIASGGSDGIIKLWSKYGKPLQAFKGNNTQVMSVRFSPDGETIASAGVDGVIEFWSKDGKPLKSIEANRGEVSSISFSIDSNTIASADGTVDDQNTNIKLWSKDGKLLQSLEGHKGGITSVNFSPDGNTIASGGWDETIKLWSKEGKLLRTLEGHRNPKGARNSVWSVSFSPDGSNLVSVGSPDNKIKLWSKDGRELQTLPGNGSGYESASFSPDSYTIAAGGLDKIKLWSRDSRKPETLSNIYTSKNFNTTASVEDGRTIKIWSKDGKLLQTLKGHLSPVRSVSFSPDGNTIASGDTDGKIILWSKDGKQLQVIESGYRHTILSITFSPDGDTIAVSGLGGMLILLNKDGQLKPLEGHLSGTDVSVSFNPDRNIIASSDSSGGKIKLWSKDGKELPGIGVNGSLVTFSPDGKTIASLNDRTITLWSKEGKILKTLRGALDRIFSISFSPDGNIIASGNRDGTITLWSKDGREIQTFKGHNGEVTQVRFSEDGKTLASTGDGKISLWNFDLDDLVKKGCDWLHDYLQNNPDVSTEDRRLCDNIKTIRKS